MYIRCAQSVIRNALLLRRPKLRKPRSLLSILWMCDVDPVDHDSLPVLVPLSHSHVIK